MNDLYHIQKNVTHIMTSLPSGVELVAAAKTRNAEEVNAAVNAGIHAIGYNYIQEAERMRPLVGGSVPWHMIGHLQRNKVKKAIELFDMIETIDSERLALEVEKQSAAAGKVMSVLIEINSGKESNKSGVLPEHVIGLIKRIHHLPHLKIMGLMTMEPRFGDPEGARPYYRITKKIFEEIKQARLPDVEMRYLSMGMSNSYRIAIAEGTNIIRIGTALFGERAE
ncbi:MAG: YggS family pyridoxal phosphate-dependent enzyme [Proteiniphilum sp.]|nr:YggS family pyridoxal phosphate-dependent enzyme [Proteiniphilum sp.]